MAKTGAMTRSQNNDDMERFKTCENGDVSELTHDVLFLVMMRLGFVDFFAFSGVCKSWRLLALSNRDKFMASRPPMLIKYRPNKNKCYLRDFEGRKVKTFLPYSANRICVGLTCGYLIFFGEENFWLVNPITRDELYFPRLPNLYLDAGFKVESVMAVLVFSPSISRWVFVMTFTRSATIWFSIQGKGAWNHVSSTFPVLDLHVFKGKIYALNDDWQVCEMSLNPEPKLTSLVIKKRLDLLFSYSKFVSAGENLYVIDAGQKVIDALYGVPMILELDFGKKNWVLPDEKTLGKYAFFLKKKSDNAAIHGAAVKLESGAADPWSLYKIFDIPGGQKVRDFFTSDMWYFPHECMNLNLIDE